MIRVLIVDDHPIFREGIKQVLADDPELQVDEACNGREALQKVRKNSYDVITLDLSMPDIGGLEVLKQIKSEKPNVNVVILSIYPEEQFAIRALKAGAAGYLTKTSVPEELVSAIKKIASGTTYITTALAAELAQHVSQRKSTQLPHESLSDRELEILTLLGKGKTVGEIADHLSLSVKTVSTHRAHILAKMRMDNNAQLMRYVIENGMAD